MIIVCAVFRSVYLVSVKKVDQSDLICSIVEEKGCILKSLFKK